MIEKLCLCPFFVFWSFQRRSRDRRAETHGENETCREFVWTSLSILSITTFNTWRPRSSNSKTCSTGVHVKAGLLNLSTNLLDAFWCSPWTIGWIWAPSLFLLPFSALFLASETHLGSAWSLQTNHLSSTSLHWALPLLNSSECLSGRST